MAITNSKILDLVPSEKILANQVKILFDQVNPLITSNLAARGEEVDRVAGGGPRKASIPYLNPLVTTEVNIGTDDITVAGSVGKLTADEYTVARHDLNYGWGTSDLARMITKYDAAGGINAGIAAYWAAIAQDYAANSIKGAIASDVSNLVSGLTTVDFSYEALVDATATAEDYADQFDLMIISPKTKAKLQKMQKFAYEAANKTGRLFDTWADFNVIVSKSFGDDCTILARAGALAYGDGVPEDMVPFEVERVANGGTGSGGNILHSRRSMVIHPQGFHYTGAVAPTAVQCADAGRWAREVPATMVGFRKVLHKI